MLKKSYAYTDNNLIKKTKKIKKNIEPSEEPGVYKKIRDTKIAKNKQTNDDDEDEEDQDFQPKGIPHDIPQKEEFTLHNSTGFIGKKHLTNFHPVSHNKYDDNFIQNLRGENETLKSHIEDLKKFHQYNNNLNNIHHYSHQMKIKLG